MIFFGNKEKRAEFLYSLHPPYCVQPSELNVYTVTYRYRTLQTTEHVWGSVAVLILYKKALLGCGFLGKFFFGYFLVVVDI
mgnify:CR=1 FL=1